jgi:hypothetical protein
MPFRKQSSDATLLLPTIDVAFAFAPAGTKPKVRCWCRIIPRLVVHTASRSTRLLVTLLGLAAGAFVIHLMALRATEVP